MIREVGRLTALAVTRAKLGMHGDGGGLWLRVQPSGRSWIFRYVSPSTGRERRMGLGTAADVTLAAARRAAAAAREQLHRGLDPLDHRQLTAAEKAREVITLRMAAASCIAAKRMGWRNAKHAAQWEATLTAYAYPALGARPVETIGKADVLEVLVPIWQARPETASRLRGRLETILDYAKQRDWRAGENPAAWKGNLQHVLAPRSRVARVQHHAAVPWKDLGRVLEALSRSAGTAALAVRFIALTAARSGEARGARWSEIDLDGAVWTVPAERMKGGREHRVPLCPEATAVLELARQRDGGGELVFPGGRAGRPLSDVAVSKALHLAARTRAVTVHGLRSTFRDWAADTTDHQPDVAEAALAHALGDAVRVAYQRGDLFEKRRGLMADWGRFAGRPTSAGS